MKRRHREQFVDVSRAHGRSVVRAYDDPTVAEQIQRLKVIRDDQLGRVAARHAQEIGAQSERHSRDRREIWATYDAAKKKLLDQAPTTSLSHVVAGKA